MKIAITGANGFLGSHLVRACLQAGHEVWAVVRPNANCNRLPSSPRLMILDVNYQDHHALCNTLEKHVSTYGKWDIILHNAGLTVSTFEKEYFEINDRITARLVQCVRESDSLDPKGKLIYISSYAAHGPSGTDFPVSAYGRSKAAAEQHIIKSGYNYIICRPTGIYGSGDMAFLPLFQAAKYGFYPLMAPKKQKITLIHGADLANGIVQHLNSNENYLHFNDGNCYSHSDFKEALSEAVGKKLTYLKLPVSSARLWLKLSDWYHQQTNSRPAVTLEKYNEISMDWDLHHTTTLYHPKISCQFDLTSGSKEAYDFYKKNKLV